MASGKRAGASTPRKRTKAQLLAENARLRRALARQARPGGAVAPPGARGRRERGEQSAGTAAAREQQTATAEILRAISQAQTDVQPVFEAIADSAMRLFGAVSAMVFRWDGELLTGVTARGGAPQSSELMMERWRGPHRPSGFSPSDQMPAHRAVLTRGVQHVIDVDTDSSWSPLLRETGEVRGFRSLLAVPMLRSGDVVGVIVVTRKRVGGFTPSEIALLQTFADQAVIAVENARLLSELRARTTELQRSVVWIARGRSRDVNGAVAVTRIPCPCLGARIVASMVSLPTAGCVGSGGPARVLRFARQ